MQNTSNNQGFTIIETLMSIALTGVFLVGLVSLERVLSSSQTTLNQATQSHNEATLALQTMTRELRNARTSATGSYPLVLANDQEILFYANIDDDPQPERVRYFLDGTLLKKGVVQPTGFPPQYVNANEDINLVINYINNNSQPIFTYYNGNWPADTDNNPLGTPSRLTDTKLINILVVINPQPNRPESAFQLESAVQIRNLKTNL